MAHPLPIPDPFAVADGPILFERMPIETPRFHRCECGSMTNNADRVCDTCVKLDSDEFGRVAPVSYSTICDCDLCHHIWEE